jgi:hypothetical protein
MFSNENKDCMRVDKSSLDITDQMSKHSRQLSLTLIKIYTGLKLMRVDETRTGFYIFSLAFPSRNKKTGPSFQNLVFSPTKTNREQ